MKIPIALLIACSSLTPALSQDVKLDAKVKAALDRVDKEKIKAHITYLADDKLKGRQPGKEGYQMAVDYVVGQYKELGLVPAGDPGSYTQKLIIRRATTDNKTAKAFLRDASGNTDSLSIGKDIVIVPGVMQNTIDTESPLVFVGYGIEVPGKYSDYDNVDVKGKIVVFIAGSPTDLDLPSTIKAHFSNAASKMEIASRKGAVGAIGAAAAVGAFNPNGVTTAAINPEKTKAFGRSVSGGLSISARLSFTGLQRLFLNSGKNLQETITALRQGKPSSFEFPTKLRVKSTSTFRDIESFNVVGKVEGSDKKLKSEFVMHSAHLDHVGVGTAVKGDSIYNGAHDNASGVASLLEIARIYKQISKPRRSVLIVMVTAEEMGLLGSAYFAGNPTVPSASIVADVNTDMPTLIAPLLSVAPLGAEHSTLATHVDFAARQLDIEVQKDPMPEENRFIRSDQYSFVLQGVPALHIKYGIKTADPSFDLVKFTTQWRDQNYHKPSDEISNSFDFEAGRKYAQLNFLISYSVAQTTERPTWNEGDFFGKLSVK